MTAAGGQMLKAKDKNKGSRKAGFSLSLGKCIEREMREHMDALAEFESIVNGVESSMKRAATGPERMTHAELFLEVKHALSPIEPDATKLRDCDAGERYVSVREQASSVSILGDTENYINIDGVLWSMISLKTPPDGTYPGILRSLLTSGFPIVISTHVMIPDQHVVLDKYKKRLKKMQAAQLDSKGNHRVDMEAQVAAKELMEIQSEILASSVKTAKVSLVIAVRTSHPAFTSQEYESAERELAKRRQQILHIISQANGSRAYGESLAQRRLLIATMPGMADEDSRDHDLLTTHAADLIPIEMPWAGTLRSPLMLSETPYRQLIPFSPFDAGLENANAIVAASSGSGKSVVVGRMLLTCARQDVQVFHHRTWRFLPVLRDVHGRPDDLDVARQYANDQPV